MEATYLSWNVCVTVALLIINKYKRGGYLLCLCKVTGFTCACIFFFFFFFTLVFLRRYKKVTNTERKIQKFLLKVKKSSFLLSMHKMGMRLICIHVAVENMVYSKPKCHNLSNVQLIFVSVQRTAHFFSRLE